MTHHISPECDASVSWKGSKLADIIKNIVILGGGSSGWMAAACLAQALGENYSIKLVESDEIGIVGVGEATIPPINLFNRFIGITIDDLIRETQATIKLGIEFKNWRNNDHSYFHPFGKYGSDMDGISFLQYWLYFKELGNDWDINRLNAETMGARHCRFDNAPPKSGPNIPINHAYQFDAFLYAKFLRKHSEKKGVKRIEGMVQNIRQNQLNGNVEALELKDGQIIEGDFFIDCSGFRAILIDGALKTKYIDWSDYLICNRALAVPCETTKPILPYTRSTAYEAGWQWRIPLQHRTGNGYVYCNGFIDDDRAKSDLLSRLDGKQLAQPRLVKFTTGHREKFWNKNVVALGLSCGFLEPLESTSIHLVQSALIRLMAYFPADKSKIESLSKKFNQEMSAEFSSIRDFIIAHYKITEREDTPFWKHCKNMKIPESLQEKLNLFIETGLIIDNERELFKETSWFAVLTGQGLWPKSYHPLASKISIDELKNRMGIMRQQIQERIEALPKHDNFINSRIGLIS